MSELLRSELYWLIHDIERDLLGPRPATPYTAQCDKDLRLAREHFFELLHQKDAEIVADFERRADTYLREETEREQQRKRAERAETSEQRPTNRRGTRAAGKRARGHDGGGSALF